MKKPLFILLTLALAAGFSSAAFAHPPSKIEAVYSEDKKELKVDIAHRVYDPKTHYIKRVVILKNGKEIISDNFEDQQNDSGMELRYVIRNLSKGDQITVQAVCNVFGSQEESIMIER